METSTKAITQEIKEAAQTKMQEYAESLLASGVDRRDLPKKLDTYLKSRVNAFYQKEKEKSFEIGNIVTGIFKGLEKSFDSEEGVVCLDPYDSKAEEIFSEMLLKANIPFNMQVKVGMYRVDYLFEDFLVFEGDGPHHAGQREYDEKRDKYLERMGYEVIRLPWNIVAMCPDEIIKGIKERLSKK